jgi:hypothetical protein
MVLQTNLLEQDQSYEINEIKAINELFSDRAKKGSETAWRRGILILDSR